MLAIGAAVLIVVSPVAAHPTGEPDAPQDITGAFKSLGRQIKKVAKDPKGAASKFGRYVKKAADMRDHHDGGDLDPGAIGDFLRRRPAGSAGAPAKGAPGRAASTSVMMTYKGSFDWPVEAGIVSSEYGPRWGKFHAGIDIAADTGEWVLASAPGTIIYAGNGLSGYGNVVIIRSDTNTTTLYGHNSKLEVREGDTVEQGARIAKVGSTGRSTGPHVHFEIRSGDKAVNPRERLPANKFIGK
jgi:murein DD-endopeptidase MepM/ murein hydrolase activator NlpD